MDDDNTKPWSWILPDGRASSDWPHYRNRLEALARHRGFEVTVLGTFCDEPLLLLQGGIRDASAPHLLVASGFHGEEPAGPWGVLEFLEAIDPEQASRIRLTVLPLVNATGFRAGTRFNARGENPNRGYRGLPGEKPSGEGLLLLSHGGLLQQASRDGLLTCHEDVLLSHGYLYSSERATTPGVFSRSLLQVNASFFPVHPDGTVDGCVIKDGIVFNHDDGSFESWLLQQGCARAACVETPGRHPIARRIAAHRAMIAAFIDHALQGAA